jgi:hypothetical protein
MNTKQLRDTYHKEVCHQILGYKEDVPSVADNGSRTSIDLSKGILTRMGFPLCTEPPNRQRANALFISVTRDYLTQAFHLIEHLRPGDWILSTLENVPQFDQYEHWTELAQVLVRKPDLYATLGDLAIVPDIVMGRSRVSDQEINRSIDVLGGDTASLTPLRANNLPDLKSILYACVSCKWTLRSNGGQKLRTEILNLVHRGRGNLPHIVAVTAEPLPTRIASLALGTGDLDCVYHFALHELKEVLAEIDNEDQMDMLRILVEGRRLRDISDLPFDLAT